MTLNSTVTLLKSIVISYEYVLFDLRNVQPSYQLLMKLALSHSLEESAHDPLKS